MATKKAVKKAVKKTAKKSTNQGKKSYTVVRSFNDGAGMLRRGEVIQLTASQAKKFANFIE